MYLQGLVIAVAIVSQCVTPSLQFPSGGNNTNILDLFHNTFTAINCKTSLIDPEKALILKKCNVPVPEKTELTDENKLNFLCMVYYDINLQICDRLKTDRTKLQDFLPQTKEDISNITNLFDSYETAEDVCKDRRLQLGQSSFKETKDYVQLFANAVSDPRECPGVCFRVDGMLNSFCRMFLWASLRLSDHNDALTGFEKMNHLLKNAQLKQESSVAQPNVAPEGIASKLMPPSVTDLPSNYDVSLIETKSVQSEAVVEPRSKIHINGNGGIAGGGLPQRPHGPPQVNPPPPVQEQEQFSSPVKEVTQNKTLPSVKPVKEEPSAGTISIDSGKVVPSVQEITPEKNTIPVKPQTVKNEPKQTVPRVEEDVNNDDDEMDMPASLDDVQKMDIDIDVDSEADVRKPIKGNAAAGEAGGAAPVEDPRIGKLDRGYIADGEFVNAEDSHFFLYFLFVCGVLIMGYIIFHNKNKILGLILEGRRGEGRRRCPGGGPAYRKLDCTLEEAVSSAPPSHVPHIIY